MSKHKGRIKPIFPPLLYVNWLVEEIYEINYFVIRIENLYFLRKMWTRRVKVCNLPFHQFTTWNLYEKTSEIKYSDVLNWRTYEHKKWSWTLNFVWVSFSSFPLQFLALLIKISCFTLLIYSTSFISPLLIYLFNI